MSPWKVILATMIIFGTGVLTGGFVAQRPLKARLTQHASTQTQDVVLPQPWFVRKEFLARLDQRLNLSPQQHERIAKILEEAQDRTRSLMLLIGPELQEELVVVRAKIRGELSPDQQPRFDEMLQRGRARPGARGAQATNTPAAKP